MTTLRLRSALAPLTSIAVAAVLGTAGCSSPAESTGSAASPSPAATSSSPSTPASPTTSASTPATSAPAGGSASAPEPTKSDGGDLTRPSSSSTKEKDAQEPKAKTAGTLPRSQGDYGESLVAAWAAGRSSTVASLATSSVAAKLRATKAPKGLLRTNCEGNMCSWSNESGARVTLTFDSRRVARGDTHGVTAARIA